MSRFNYGKRFSNYAAGSPTDAALAYRDKGGAVFGVHIPRWEREALKAMIRANKTPEGRRKTAIRSSTTSRAKRHPPTKVKLSFLED